MGVCDQRSYSQRQELTALCSLFFVAVRVLEWECVTNGVSQRQELTALCSLFFVAVRVLEWECVTNGVSQRQGGRQATESLRQT